MRRGSIQGKELRSFVGDRPVHYEKESQDIVSEQGLHIISVRGWGRLQKEQDAEKAQGSIGLYLAECLNSLMGFSAHKSSVKFYFDKHVKLPLRRTPPYAHIFDSGNNLICEISVDIEDNHKMSNMLGEALVNYCNTNTQKP